MTTFAEQLSSARKAAGMTQEQLSEAVHVARNTISNWECGRRRPDLNTIRLLGEILHTDFLNGEEFSGEIPAGGEMIPGDGVIPGEEKAVLDMMAAEENLIDEQEVPEPGRKRKPWAILLTVLAAIAVGMTLWFTLGNKNVSPEKETASRETPETAAYQPAARLADEAGQLPLEFFQTLVQKTQNMPYLSYRYDTELKTEKGKEFFYYNFRFRETNGYPFRIKRAVVYEYPSGETIVTPFSPEDLQLYSHASEIPAYGEWSIRGGFPVASSQDVAIILYGEDENGTEMEFHGCVEYEKAMKEHQQKQ